jgi:hypothetical protein
MRLLLPHVNSELNHRERAEGKKPVTMAFSTGLYTVLASRLHWLAIAICVLVALLPIITWLLGKWPVLKLRFRLGKSVRSDFLDMV